MSGADRAESGSFAPGAKIGRYTLGPEIGRGATSVVHEAQGPSGAVAIKLLTSRAPEAALRFRRGAAALARVRHPCLVPVIELGEDAGTPLLVMGLAAGRSLRARLEGGPLPEAAVARIGVDLASALGEIHRQGLLHRDLKPENVIVDDDGGATLVDFGLVGSGDSGQPAGTPQYAAPELLGVLVVPPSPASDLYGLGATLFEALTGQPPLRADGDFLHRLATVAPPDARTLRVGTSPALATVLARLLAKDPDDRYSTADGLAHDLGRLPALDATLARGEEPDLRVAAPTWGAQRGEFVGREEERAQIAARWESVQQGSGGAVLVRGEAGAGKSRLVRQAAMEAEAAGALVLGTKCQRIDETPLAALRELAQALTARVQGWPRVERHAERARWRVIADGSPIGELSPGLADAVGSGAGGMELEPGAQQQRFYAAIARFVAGLGTAARPLVWVLDDVQWLDPASREVLGILAREAPPHLLLLVTARPAPAAAVAAFLRSMEPLALDSIDLAPFDAATIERFVADRLGGGALDPAVLGSLVAASHGNPFALEETLRALLDSGLLRPSGTSWTAPPEELTALALPDDVLDLLIRRLDTLPDEVDRVLRVCAVLGGPTAADRLAQVTGLAPEAVSATLTRLGAEGVLHRDGAGRWSFQHDRVREAAYGRLGSAERADTHQAIAEALDQAPGDDTDLVYARARHARHGHPDRDPPRAAAANLAGGLRALEQHAYEAAWEMLHFAESAYGDAIPGALHAPLGRACAMTGRLDDAFAQLDAALPHATSRWERFELQYLITLSHASQGQNDRGLVALYEAFELLGRPFPRSAVAQALSLAWHWGWVLVLGALGDGDGAAGEEETRRRMAVSRLHYVGSMLALFDGDVFLTLQFIVRDLANVRRLPPCGEKAIATTNYGSLLGSFGLGGPMRRHTARGVALAEQTGDAAAIAVCNAYRAVGHKWAGDLDEGTALQLAALPPLTAEVPGSWYASMMITEQSYSYMHCGRARAAHAHTLASMPAQDRTGNLLFTYNTRAVHYAACEILGDTPGAARAWGVLEPHFARYGDEMRLTRGQARFERMIDRRDFADFEAALPELQDQLGEDYYSLYAWQLLGYAEMLRLEDAEDAERAPRRAALAKVVRATFPRFLTPVFRCHLHVWRAALARSRGATKKANKALDKAEELAGRVHSPLATFRIAEQRAALAADAGAPIAQWHAQRALTIARDEGWRNKAAQVAARFGLDEAPAVSTPTPSSGPGDRERRFADALLEVSLASSGSVDVGDVAEQALAATARVLGAERALFFVVDATGALELAASVGDDVDRISASAVERARTSGAPVVYTGDERGEAVTESIVGHGLRSVLAAPLVLRGEVVGVMYLDNRLARGLFSAEDAALLRGIGSQIAVALQTARAATLEAHNATLARDAERVGAVQELLLPGTTRFGGPGLWGEAWYRPADRAGGDWWWHEVLPDGGLLVWMGDVNGHGAGPAMLTATVSGAFTALRAHQPELSVPEMLEALNRQLADLGGRLLMSMTVVGVPAAGETLSVWTAGGPPALRLRGEEIDPVGAAGSLLGEARSGFAAGVASIDLAPGDRVVLTTDGLLELESRGRPLGVRGLTKLVSRPPGRALPEVVRSLTEAVDKRLAGRPQPDDITIAVVEVGTEPPA